MLNSEFNIFVERLPSVGSRAWGGLGWFIFAIRQIDSEWIKTDKRKSFFLISFNSDVILLDRPLQWKRKQFFSFEDKPRTNHYSVKGGKVSA